MEKTILKKILKIFLISSVSILAVVALMKLSGRSLENFFIWRFSSNRDLFSASFLNVLSSTKPIRNWEVEDLDLEVESALSAEIDSAGQKKILFKRNEDKPLPIASLTKLMTALVVLEDYDASHLASVSSEAVSQEGFQGELKVGETLSVENLLYIMLMESSNDAAYALSEVLGKDAFVALMNLKAKVIGLSNTTFVNPTGLDSVEENGPMNYSTTEDLIKLTHYILKKEPLVFRILSLKEFHLYRPDGTYHHKLVNTNELIGQVPDIVGGKTGWTPKARGCLLLILDNPIKNGYLVYIILGSDNNRFEEMKKMIDWTNNAYTW